MRARRLGLAFALILVAPWAGGVPPASGQAPAASPAVEIPIFDDLAPGDIDALTDELLAADLERFGVTVWDPELPEILAGLRAAAAQDLGDILAEQPPPWSEATERRSHAIAAVGSGSMPTRSRTYDQGPLLLGIMGMLSVDAVTHIVEVHPAPTRMVYAPGPQESSDTVTVGGRVVATHQLAELRQELDGSSVKLTRRMLETFAIPGRDGRLQATVTDDAEVVVEMEVCPNANGLVWGRITARSETVFDAPEGPGYHSTYFGSDILSAVVEDTAQVGYSRHREEARRVATGLRPAFGAEPAVSTDATVTLVSNHEALASGGGSDALWVSHANGADLADYRMTGGIIGLTRAVANAALKAAAEVWQGGRCLKVVATPGTSEVYPGSSTPIEVSIRHIVEESDVERKVKATLQGPVSVSPTDPIDAPGTVTFLASNEEATTTIIFRTVSNRGIAETREAYTVDPEACPPPTGMRAPGGAHLATLEGGPLVAQADEEDCPRILVLSGTITGDSTSRVPSLERSQASIQVTLTLTYDDRWGDWTSSGTATLDSEITGDCHFSFHESMPFDYAYTDHTSGIWSGNMFIAVQPAWGLLPEERHLEELPMYVEIAGIGDATCGHETGNIVPWSAGVAFGTCEELLVANLGGGSWHGECHEPTSDYAEASWIVTLQEE